MIKMAVISRSGRAPAVGNRKKNIFEKGTYLFSKHADNNSEGKLPANPVFTRPTGWLNRSAPSVVSVVRTAAITEGAPRPVLGRGNAPSH